MKRVKSGLFMVIIVALILCYSNGLNAASPDYEFFKGKIITYIVATQPGGGYDVYARLIGKYMQKFIPGSTVIIKNMPGAGHIIGANELYLSKPDGLTIGTFSTGLIYSQIIGLPGIRFDLRKYSWIGKANAENRVFIVSKNTHFRNIKDVLEHKEPIKMATSGVGTADHNETLIIASALGANLKVIPGYGGRGGEMAMLRGEIDGEIGSYGSLASFIKAEKCPVILQFGAKKHRELPDVPLASDMKLSERGKKLVKLISGIADLWRLTAAAPGMPSSRLDILRDAYKKAVTSPDLLKEASKVNLDFDPNYGKDVERMVTEAINQPEENVSLLKNLIKVD
jgi:tripartite-type tricarboxylate transporter receptor subunit TctC